MSKGRHALLLPAASPDIGLGHVHRTLALAAEFTARGWTWQIALNDQATRNAVVATTGLPPEAIIDRPPPTDGYDLVIVDDYALGAAETSVWRENATVLAIDDLADRELDADVLVNYTIDLPPTRYDRLLPEFAKRLIGADYAILRPEFAQHRERALARRKKRGAVSRLLIALSATDPDNVTGTVVEGVGQSNYGGSIDVVLSSAAPHLAAVRNMVDAMVNCTLHVDSMNMARLMTDADIAIGAGGTSVYERCCLGLPTIILQIADNQADNVAAVCARGAAAKADITADAVREKLEHMLSSPNAITAMSEAAFVVCDGHGAARIVDAVESAVTLPGAI